MGGGLGEGMGVIGCEMVWDFSRGESASATGATPTAPRRTPAAPRGSPTHVPSFRALGTVRAAGRLTLVGPRAEPDTPSRHRQRLGYNLYLVFQSQYQMDRDVRLTLFFFS